MVENQTLEQELGEMTDAAATTEAPPTQHPIFGNISLVVPKRSSAKRLEMIATRVELLMGAYRRDAFDNPGIFVSSVTQLFETFPDCVIESVTSPRSGLQTECTFPPSLAEIRARCERSLRQYSTISLANARKKLVAQQAKNPPAVAPVEPKVDLIATHPYFKREAIEKRLFDPFATLKKLAAEAGHPLTDEQIAAMPNNSMGAWKKVTSADHEELTKGI